MKRCTRQAAPESLSMDDVVSLVSGNIRSPVGLGAKSEGPKGFDPKKMKFKGYRI